MYCAGAATILFAVAIAVAGSAAGDPRAANAVRALSQGIGLISAGAYALAFVPPRWLRGWWSGTTALTVGRKLLDAPATEAPEDTWSRYAAMVARVSGAEAVLVLATDGDRALAVAGHRVAPEAAATCTALALERLTAMRQPVRLTDLPADVQCVGRAAPRGTRYLTAVPLRTPGG